VKVLVDKGLKQPIRYKVLVEFQIFALTAKW